MTPAHSKREPPPTQNKIESLNAIVNALHTTFYCVNKGGGASFTLKMPSWTVSCFVFSFQFPTWHIKKNKNKTIFLSTSNYLERQHLRESCTHKMLHECTHSRHFCLHLKKKVPIFHAMMLGFFFSKGLKLTNIFLWDANSN